MNNEILKKINRVYSNLCDEESKEIFEAKFNYIIISQKIYGTG